MQQLMRALAVASLLLAAGRAPAQELWRIGEFDGSYDEFACARDYAAYPRTFPRDVTFRVGVSQPKQDWSYVQPGPADYWAGSRAHPSTIEFELRGAPTSPLRLLIDLVDVQGFVPTSLGLKVNETEGFFRLKNGNEASIADPRQGKEQAVSVLLPASLLRAGLNRIVIWSTGSWFLYDAISLRTEPGAVKPASIRTLTLEPTVLFRRLPQGGLGQVVLARIEVEGPPEGITLTAQAGGARLEQRPKPGLVFGTIEEELLVPEVRAETPLAVEAKLGQSAARAATMLKPQRHWRIYMAASTHTDIGYTDLQSRVVERHNENTDRAVALCDQFPAFGWNLETAWQADMYREHRTSAQRSSRATCERLYALARSGRIGIQASYLNMLTGLCSHEELNRWLYYAHSLKRLHGVPFESALTTDVPTQVWSLPSTLAAAGIRYYATGINSYRGYGFTKLQTGYPFWWEGPDGSRVLAYFAPGYAHAGGALQSAADLRSWILSTTRSRADFPYDALFLYGAIGDNGALPDNIARSAQEWADRYEYPKVIVGPNAEYFRYMERTYGDNLPVVRGDGGAYWEDGAASSALETALDRRAHETASVADALFALSALRGGKATPQGRLSALWRNILLYDEHTWGAWCSVSDPDSAQTVQQWKVKASFAHVADRQSRELLAEGLSRLASQVRTGGPALLLFNATSWDREGEVCGCWLPPDRVPLDPRTRQPLLAYRMAAVRPPGERAGQAWVVFRAPTVPAWGYAVCPLGEGKVPEASTRPLVPGETPALENRLYRLVFDPGTGGIASLTDKMTGRELVDRHSGQGLNQYLYVSGGDGTNIVDLGANKPAQLTIHTATVREWTRTSCPGLQEVLTCTGEGLNTPFLSSTTMLREDDPRIEFANVVRRVATRTKEAAYFAFPLALTRPQVRLEIPNGVLRPEADQLPGACKDWYSMQHFVRLSDAQTSVAWASPDAPLVCVGDINRGLWQEKLEVKSGHLYSYIMNNYWATNYKADQGGEFGFSYSLTTRAATDAEAARFGWQASMPLRCQVIERRQPGPLPPHLTSFCRADPPGVIITAVKAPEAGRGVVVRLFSLEPRTVTVRLRCGLPKLKSAALCNLMEEPLEGLPMNGSGATLRVAPQRPTTVWFR